MKEMISRILYWLAAAGTACFMLCLSPDLLGWSLHGLGERTRSIPWFPFLWMSFLIFTCLLPIPCCWVGYRLMRRNKEDSRYPAAKFIFWTNLALIVCLVLIFGLEYCRIHFMR